MCLQQAKVLLPVHTVLSSVQFHFFFPFLCEREKKKERRKWRWNCLCLSDYIKLCQWYSHPHFYSPFWVGEVTIFVFQSLARDIAWAWTGTYQNRENAGFSRPIKFHPFVLACDIDRASIILLWLQWLLSDSSSWVLGEHLRPGYSNKHRRRAWCGRGFKLADSLFYMAFW